MEYIEIHKANANNLKNLSLKLPHNKLIVFSGISGSGKSSLVYDVIYKEAQRLYLQSFSNVSKRIFRMSAATEVEQISGLRPVIAVGSDSGTQSSRSTVGTHTDIWGYLRLLFARYGKAPNGEKLNRGMFSFNAVSGYCEKCMGLGKEEFIDVDKLIKDENLTLAEGALTITTDSGYIIYSQVTMDVLNQVCEVNGFNVHIPWKELTDEQKHIVLNGSDKIKIPYGKHTLESRLKWSGITAKPREEGFYKGIIPVMADILKRDRNKNILKFVSSRTCSVCQGKRLNKLALSVTWQGKSIAELGEMSISNLYEFLCEYLDSNNSNDSINQILYEIIKRLQVLIDLGGEDLNLLKETSLLKASEHKVMRLINQLFGGLSNLIYVFDEPASGLHPKMQSKLLEYLFQLRNAGNTVLVIEHSPYFQKNADLLVDIGPKAGADGGNLLFIDKPENIAKYKELSLTAGYLCGTRNVFSQDLINKNKEKKKEQVDIEVIRTEKTSLKGFKYFLNTVNVITGVKSSGNDIPVFDIIKNHFDENPGKFSNIITITGSKPGKTIRSTPATYTGAFDIIRKIFAKASQKKFSASDFSFNNKNYRCPKCEGAGSIKTGLHFMGENEFVCPQCKGKRYNDEILQSKYQSKSIAEVLNMSVDEACMFFDEDKKLTAIFEALKNLGCGYLSLGQSSSSLSTGESQRVKLALHIAKGVKKNALFLFDEPVSGLHTYDTENFLKACYKLTENNHTVMIIENDEGAINNAGFVINLCKKGIGLYEISEKDRSSIDKLDNDYLSSDNESINASGDLIIAKGVSVHNLKGIDVEIPKNKITVITGPSGSGKSSLAFSAIFAESQNRYLNNFSNYIREQIGLMPPVKADSFLGLTPVLSVSSKSRKAGRRSTVGTASGILDLYRLYFARYGKGVPDGVYSDFFSFNRAAGACNTCGGVGVVKGIDVDKLLVDKSLPLSESMTKSSKVGAFYGDSNDKYIAILHALGKYLNVDFSVPVKDLSKNILDLVLYGYRDVELDVEWHYKRKNRTGVHKMKAKWEGFESYILEEYERESANGKIPRSEILMKNIVCYKCKGTRYKQEVLKVIVEDKNIAQISNESIKKNIAFFETIKEEQSEYLRKEIIGKLKRLESLRLSYLSLSRLTDSLSVGEQKRLKMAELLNSGITGTSFIIDEPTLGLGQKDIAVFVGFVEQIKNLGNTLIFVEHNPELIKIADNIIELGLKGGTEGGRVVASGSLREIKMNKDSLTGKLLAKDFALKNTFYKNESRVLFKSVFHNNLKDINLGITLNKMTVVTGESGAGKSSLLFGCIEPSLSSGTPVGCKSIEVGDFKGKVLSIDSYLPESYVGSLVSEYLPIFAEIKKIFSKIIKDSCSHLSSSALSFRSKHGACPQCKGRGTVSVNLDFIAETEPVCELCSGKRYNEDVLNFIYKGKSIADVLEMTFTEVQRFFKDSKTIVNKINLLNEVGLGYLNLNRTMKTLSGGELRRIKIVKMLLEKEAVPYIVLMDEPSAGLFYTDIEKLLVLFDKLIKAGNTLVIAEHNMQVISAANHIIKLGPEGGDKGGYLLS